MPTSNAVIARGGATPWQVAMEGGGHAWLGDEPVEKGGADTGPTPKQLLASALAMCTNVTVRMYAARKQWPLTGIEVLVDIDEDTPGTATFQRAITLHGELVASQRERLLQVAEACPVHKLLRGEIHIVTTVDGATP